MRAAILTAPEQLSVTTVPRPVAGEGEQVVRLRYGGICGTDLHGYHGDNPFLIMPRILGHELAGVVQSDGAVAVGTPVAINPMITCGDCPACRKGRRNACARMQVLGVHVDGGFRTELAVPSSMLVPLPAAVPLELGALVEPLSIGANACLRGEVGPGLSVLVLGAGCIGLACLLVAKAHGARVMVADALPARLELARQLGADALLDVRQAGEDELEAFAPDGPELVIEAAGRADVLRRALELVAPAGVVVTLMITAETMTLPVTELIIRKEVDLRGSRLNRDLFGEVVELLSNKVINPRPLITHRFPLSSAAAAFRLAIDKPGEALKVLLQIED